MSTARSPTKKETLNGAGANSGAAVEGNVMPSEIKNKVFFKQHTLKRKKNRTEVMVHCFIKSLLLIYIITSCSFQTSCTLVEERRISRLLMVSIFSILTLRLPICNSQRNTLYYSLCHVLNY